MPMSHGPLPVVRFFDLSYPDSTIMPDQGAYATCYESRWGPGPSGPARDVWASGTGSTKLAGPASRVRARTWRGARPEPQLSPHPKSAGGNKRAKDPRQKGAEKDTDGSVGPRRIA